MLLYIKERDGHPLAEEKQLLDCLKVVLDNGWTFGTDEMLKLFDILELSKKVCVHEDFSSFLEFVYLLGMMFKVDTIAIENYFSLDKHSDFFSLSFTGGL